VQQFHDVSQRLPAAWSQTPDGKTGYGWALDLLPHIDESLLSTRVARHIPITATQNDALRHIDLPIMRCPSDIAAPTFALFKELPHSAGEKSNGKEKSYSDGEILVRLPMANYLGVFGTLEADDTIPAPNGDGSIVFNRRVRLSDLERGLSHTLLLGERTAAMAPSTWLGVSFLGEDAACRLVGSAITAPNCNECDECELASRHVGGANFTWADGHVSLVAEHIDSIEYQRLAKRNVD